VCRTKLALVGTVSAIILTWLWLWQWFSDAPKEFLITCTIGDITFQALYYVRSTRRSQRQLELDVLRTRQRVYQELSRNANSNNNVNNSSTASSAVLANMILNRIVWEWFPLNRAERQRWSVRSDSTKPAATVTVLPAESSVYLERKVIHNLSNQTREWAVSMTFEWSGKNFLLWWETGVIILLVFLGIIKNEYLCPRMEFWR
jgi:hypothetical protein